MASMDDPIGAGAGRRLIVAGGGTGGHLFPGIAVAQAFLFRNRRNQVLFINAGRPLEIDVLSRLQWPYRTIGIEGIKGRGFWGLIRALSKTPWAIWCSRAIIHAFAPHVVLGVGGYSAGPVVTAAWLMGIPTAVHEQNRLPGLTNRLLRRIVDRIYLTFLDETNRFDDRKTLVTGNPVRDEILALGAKMAPPPDSKVFNVLILGGSQGARAINHAVVAALPLLKGCVGLQVVHQTGREDQTWVADAYHQNGLAATVQPFFNDVAIQYQKADLIICRAGATTVAEITAVGRAALLIPFPHAADDHQMSNAQALANAGAAAIIPQRELSGEILASTIIDFMGDRSRLMAMAARARTLGRPEAALTIVGDLYALMGERAAD